MADVNPYIASQSAIQNLGNAVEGAVFGVVDKLETAEYGVQMSKAQTYATRQISDLNLRLAADPNWQSYGGKWDEERQKIEDSMFSGNQALVTNNRARTDMQVWWAKTGETQRENINNLQFNARVARVHTDYLEGAANSLTDISTGKTNADGSLFTPDQAQAAWREEQNLLVATGVITPERAASDDALWRKQAEIDAVQFAADTAARAAGDVSNGFDMIDKMRSNPMFSHMEDKDFTQIASNVQSFQSIRESAINKKADEANSQFVDQIVTKAGEGAWDEALNVWSKADWKATVGMSAMTAQDKRQQELTWILEHQAMDKRATQHAISDDNNPVFRDLIYRANLEGADAKSLFDEGNNDMYRGVITDNQLSKLKAITNPILKARGASFASEFTAGAKDTNLPLEVRQQYQMGLANFYDWYSNHTDAPDDVVRGYANALTKAVNEGVVRAHIADTLSQSQQEKWGLFGAGGTPDAAAINEAFRTPNSITPVSSGTGTTKAPPPATTPAEPATPPASSSTGAAGSAQTPAKPPKMMTDYFSKVHITDAATFVQKANSGADVFKAGKLFYMVSAKDGKLYSSTDGAKWTLAN